MSEKERTSSSSSAESSPSEGEYMIQDLDGPPKFDFSCWTPEAPAGLQFLSLLPVEQGYEVKYGDQEDHVGKIKVSSTHRRGRRKRFTLGKPLGKNILEEKKLRQAADNNDHIAVLDLLENGVDPCNTDNKKRSPLHFAAAKGNEQIIRLLLDYGANPNQKDFIGNTPLHLGTDVNSLDNMGQTPLHLAHSRLKLLQGSTSYTSEQLKTEVTQIVGMMKEYLTLKGQTEVMGQLDALCDQLANTSTREEVDTVSDLLTTFTNLTLQKKSTEQPG